MAQIVENPQAVARERVATGAAYLDAEFPGWEAYVDLDHLAMESSQKCILAQLDENDPRLAESDDGWCGYNRALRYIYPDWRPLQDGTEEYQEWPQKRGFYTWMTYQQPYYDGVDYTHLQNAWVDLLTERQARFAVRPGSTPPAEPMSAAEDRAFSDAYQERGIFEVDASLDEE